MEFMDFSDSTWKLIDLSTRFSRTEDNFLHRQIRQALTADRKRRTEDAGKSVDDLLSRNKLLGAWRALQAWYKYAGGRTTYPSKTDIQKLQTEYSELLTNKPPVGEPLPVLVDPFRIIDYIPSDQEIGKAVGRLHNGRSPGPTGIRAEDLKEWRDEAWREKSPDYYRWDKVINLIQYIYETGKMPTEIPWSVLVAIPKSSGG
jgi:hypothetical protein